MEWNKIEVSKYFRPSTDYKVWEARFKTLSKMLLMTSLINTVTWLAIKQNMMVIFNGLVTIALLVFMFGGRTLEREERAKREHELKQKIK